MAADLAQTSPSESVRTRALGLSALLLGMGALHFVAPKYFDDIIPPELPGEPRTYTYASGVVELTAGALLLPRRTRSLGGRLAFLLFLAVLPGNLQMARDWLASDKPAPLKAGVLLRLPLQIPLLTTARKVYRAS
ncbi:hypothetical protein [Nocardia sp. NPDC020380]|uniref:hypothetical protein n=1 Tax=Nocardia sp. NPDC020380 TaxID=3364309 RepID=UPI0037A87FE6